MEIVELISNLAYMAMIITFFVFGITTLVTGGK